MIQWIVVLVVFVSLVAGVYALVLINTLRNKYKIAFLDSLLYYQLLILIFGAYGILGNMIIHEILPKFDVIEPNIEAIAHFFPFISTPFMMVAWFMAIKMTGELLKRNRPQYVAIIYFMLVTLAFFIYGLTIKKMPEFNLHNYQLLKQKVIIVFYSVDLAVSAYMLVRILVKGPKIKSKRNERFVIRFASIFVTISVMKAVFLHFSGLHWITGLYFIFLFFSGAIPLIFLSRVYLSENSFDYIDLARAHDDLHTKFKITKREREIINEICKGKTNKQIAEELFISLQTVKDHTHNIFTKTGLRNRVQLARKFS